MDNNLFNKKSVIAQFKYSYEKFLYYEEKN
jgi:hypothetical protein